MAGEAAGSVSPNTIVIGIDVLMPQEVVLDPSRVAARIVSGIGFIGAGLILVRRDSVRGLTATAGAAPAPRYRPWRSPPRSPTSSPSTFSRRSPVVCRPPYAPSAVRVVHEGGRGILRRILQACTPLDFKVADVRVERGDRLEREVTVSLEVHGGGSVAALAADLGEIDGVHGVAAGHVNEIFDT